MKIQFNPTKKLQGSAMMAILILAVVVAVTLAAYLVMVKNEYVQVGRSQVWNNSMVLAESGTEEGMSLVNSSVIAGNSAQFQVTNWPSKYAANGWQNPGGGNVYFKSNNVDGTGNGGYYNVWITNNIGGTNPIIVSVGVANWNLGVASAPGPMFAMTTALPTTQSQVTRQVYVQTSFQPIFGGAMVTLVSVNLGSGSVVDSFDSTDPNASAWNANWGYGIYTASKRKANGTVATDGFGSGAISGGGTIYGSVDTGPGGGISVSPVGDLAWVNGGSSGIQPGHSADDMNVTFAPASLPTNLGNPTTTAATTISTSGYYQINSVGNLTIQANTPTHVDVTIYAPNGITYSGNSAMNIGTNCTVTIYTGGDIKLTGNGAINNNTQNALNLAIYALPNVANINFQGQAAFTGTIYAPSADIVFGGGGSTTYDLVGSIVSKSVNFNGHPNFHYDENLAKKGPSRGFVPTIWTEVVAH